MATPLSDVDPAFVVLAREVYGSGVDVRELWDVSKSMPGASDTHVDGPVDPKKQKRIAQTGLAATGVATVGGLHAIHATLKAAKSAAPEAAKAGKIVGKLPIKSPKVAAAVGTAGWLGLHGVELVGDSLAARAQVKNIQAANKKPSGGTGTIAKARISKAKVPHVSPEALVRADSRARRSGLRLLGATGVAAGAGAGYAVGSHARPVVGRLKPKVATANPDGPVAKAQVDSRVIEISKLDDDKHLIFGWANLAEKDGEKVIDLQGDYVSIDEIEKSAYTYMLTSRKGGDMHKRLSKFDLDAGPVHVADVVESFVVTPEKLEAMGLEPDALPLGWWTGMKVHDEDVWQKVKTGEYTGLSIHGSGTRSDMVFA